MKHKGTEDTKKEKDFWGEKRRDRASFPLAFWLTHPERRDIYILKYNCIFSETQRHRGHKEKERFLRRKEARSWWIFALNFGTEILGKLGIIGLRQKTRIKWPQTHIPKEFDIVWLCLLIYLLWGLFGQTTQTKRLKSRLHKQRWDWLGECHSPLLKKFNPRRRVSRYAHATR